MSNRKRRGIAIIISLMMMVLVIMFVTAMVITFPTTVESSRDSAEGRMAQAAAQCGVDYAWCRLQERPTWKGDGAGNGLATTISTPHLTVVEDHGDVWGFLNDSLGNKSQFRIRFNWHDGAGGGDALSNPATMIPTEFVSYNNLDKAASADVYRADPNSTAAVTQNPSKFSNPLAQYSCCVLVEGLAGTGLSRTTVAAPLPAPGAGRVVRQTLEVDLGRPTLANLDSAVYGGKISAGGAGQVVDVESKAQAAPRSRTLSDIAFSGGAKYQTPAGGSIVASDAAFNSVPSAGPAPTIVHEDINSQRKKYLSVKMTDIAQATPADPQLPAGTYVWRATGVLDYYPTDFAGTIPTGAPAATFHNSAELTAHMGATGTPILLDKTTFTLQYNTNIYVQPQGTIKSLAIVPEPTIATVLEDRPKNLFQGTSTSAPVLTGTGDITMKGSLIGKGSVTTTGDMTFQGASVFESDPGKNVAIYAGGNVTMEQIPPEVATNLNPGNASSQGHHHSMHHHGHSSFNFFGMGMSSTGMINSSSTVITNRLGPLDGNDVMIAGLVYAGGNFTTNLGSGTMYVRGAVVAYGGNADAGDLPGTPGKGGEVVVNSKGAQFTFDPTYVVSSMSLNSATRLSLTLQNRY
ncbi:hypothetical protein JST97_29885 [bacterium]|nr:hypothetical protein [bacterium]